MAAMLRSRKKRKVFIILTSFVVLLLGGYSWVAAMHTPLLPVPQELPLSSTSPSAGVKAIAVSPTSNTLVVTSWEQPLCLFDRQSGQKLRTFRQNGDYNKATPISFSRDGKLLASGDPNNRVSLWDVQSGALRQTLIGHSGALNAVVFSSNGKTLASGGDDKTIRLWDVQQGKLQRTFTMSHRVQGVSFSRNDSILNGADLAGTVQQWNTKTGNLLRTLSAPQNAPSEQEVFYPVVFSADGTLMARGSTNNKVQLWSLQTGELLLTLPGHHESTHTIAFSPNNKLIATVGRSGQNALLTGASMDDLKLWDTQTGALLGKSKDSFFRAIAFDSDGKTLITAERSSTLLLWDIRGLTQGKRI